MKTSKTRIFFKFFKNINSFINNLLEKNLNKLNFKKHKYLLKSNKIVLTFVALLIAFISYLLLPTFYSQSNISKKINTEIKRKFDLDLKFSNNLKYNIFPRPHFSTIKSTIIDDQKEISKISKLKVYISINNLFSLQNLELKDVVFDNANFNININNYNFFTDLINKDFMDGKLIINNSNIFFKNLKNEVLFINKILKMKYFYESKELRNILFSDNELFNVPFSIKSFLNLKKDKMFSNIYFKKMKLKVENEFSFNDQIKIGKSELVFNNTKKVAEYEITKNFFKFFIVDKIEQPTLKYKGEFNFKPFYAKIDGDLNVIDLNYLFSSNAFVVQLLKTEIFNNKNIDFELDINSKNIFKNSSFINLNFNFRIKEGLIDADKTEFEWKDFADFELQESLVYVRDGELVLDGKLKINIKDYKKIYKFLLTPKNYRNKIQKIDLNFTYNFDQKIVELKDIKVDNKVNEKLNSILNNVILQEGKLQNKIYLKNLLNKAIKIYAG